MTEADRGSQFLDLLTVIRRHIKILIAGTLSALVIGLALAFTVTRYYQAITRVLPPKESAMLSGLGGISSLMKSLPAGLNKIGGVDDAFNYMAILKSQTVMASVVEKFSLKSVYEIPDSSLEKAIKELRTNVEVDWTEENALEIRVWDKDRVRAAAIADYLVELLNERSIQLQTQEASNNRKFIEQRVIQNREDLRKAEEELKAYQETHGSLIISDVNSASLSPIAELYATRAVKEMELDVIAKTMGETNAQYRQKKVEFEVLNSRLQKFPEIGVRSVRLFREIAIQQKIMEMLVPLYEQAKVSEHKDVPVAYLLDKALASERPDRPKRASIVGIATILGFLLSLVFITLREYLGQLQSRDPRRYEQLRTLFFSRKPAARG